MIPAHLKAEMEQLNGFIRDVVGPWATQARISQVIASDYDAASRTLGERLQTAVKTTFAPGAAGQAQVGGAGRSYLGPAFKPLSKQTKDGRTEKLINRSVNEQEIHDGRTYVRMYTTVFAEAARSVNKDVQQKPNGDIALWPKDNDAFWVSGGQPLRALKWLAKYSTDPGARPLIRAFLLPLETYHTISAAAVPEDNAPRDGDATFNVDVHAASDQFGVRANHLHLMSQKAKPNSLITYTDVLTYATPAVSGKVEYANTLRRRLGIPEQSIDAVFVQGQKFQERKNFEGIADDLMHIYGAWYGQEDYMTEDPNPHVLVAKLNKYMPGGLKPHLEQYLRTQYAPGAALGRNA